MAIDISTMNSAQAAATLDTEGAVLVLAGAGSGKTRVLTHRVAHLVEDKGVPAYRILAITFTNKATQEMKQRLKGLLGEENKVWVSTFHSLCSSILKINAASLQGYDVNFSIYDEGDAGRLVKRALREMNLDATAIKDKIRHHISKAKNAGLSPDEYCNTILDNKDVMDIGRLFVRYEELLKENNAMDFDDLLYKTKALFEYAPDVLAKYQERFKYIHVDEFQDTNAVQYDLVKMLSAKHNNLFVVGDDDQSIYGWRGAVVTNILEFEKNFPGTKVHKLLQNYRSTENIIDAANKLISHNTERHDKQLFTNNGKGVPVEYHTAYNDYQEADFVINTIVSLKRNYGYTNKDFAILVRANSLSRLFENKMSGASMTYQVLGGFRFFERKEIQDVIAYMRVINNMRDGAAVERIINFPRRGIGDTTIAKLVDEAKNRHTDLMDIIMGIERSNLVNAGTVKKIAEFKSVIFDIYNMRGAPLNEFCDYVIKRAGFEDAYCSTAKEEDVVRWENIQEFQRHTKEFVDKNPEVTLDEYLQSILLVPDANLEGTVDGQAITLATMHSVKGLEFKVVFIVGCEEDVFPSIQVKIEEGIEEERRVMYVAITRAEQRLYITNVKDRFRFNKHQYNEPSRFIEESGGKKILSGYDAYEQRKQYTESRGKFARPNKKYPSAPSFPDVPAPQQKQKVVNTDTSIFSAGEYVKHPVYGTGKIIIISGVGSDAAATVSFEKFGIKKFKLALAPLKKAD
ncbi:MAG: UvrD-helicase domain-containing protein [Bacillota bacterium]